LERTFRSTIPRLVAAVGALLCVACGTAGAPQASRAGAPSGQWQPYDPHWANAKYADCMRQHGVPVAGPDSYGDLGFGQQHIDRATFLAAQKVCEPLWPPSRGFSIDEIVAFQQYRDKMQACLQENGGGAPGSPAAQQCRSQLGTPPEIHGPHP
jgi:hypothetical protein